MSVQLFENPPFLSFSLHQIAEQENAGVLLFVDQLEEIYTLASNPDVRRRFMTAVCGAADDVESRVRVVLTLRDDFLVRLAETPVVREALGRDGIADVGAEALREHLVMTPVRLAWLSVRRSVVGGGDDRDGGGSSGRASSAASRGRPVVGGAGSKEENPYQKRV